MKAYRITDWLIANGCVEDEERDIINFGIGQGLLIILNIVTTITLGIVLGVVFESIIFLMSFMILRSYAGGYHADTKIKCYLSSVIIIIISFTLLKNLLWTKSFCFLVSMLTTIIIFILAPVSNLTNPLDKKEVMVYKQRTRKIVVVENIAMLISIILDLPNIHSVITVTFILVAFLLIAGKFKYNQ